VFIFGIIFFLSRLKSVDENLEEYEIDAIFKMLLKFIIIPLILIYTGVLYVYLGKILVYLKIPNGVISHLVLWYTTFSLFIIVIVTPMAEKDNIISLFKKIFPKVSVPLIILSLIAIFIRIKQYAVTESRYYIVIIALWLLFCMILYIFRTNRTNLTFIIVSLIFIIFVAIYSPVNAVKISLLSQNKRLEKLLVQNGLVKDGKLVKNPALSNSAKAEIDSVVDYLLYKGMSPYSVKRSERAGNLQPFGKTYENPEEFKNAIGMDRSWDGYYSGHLKETKIIYKINENIQYDNYISKVYGYEYLIQYVRDYGKYQKVSEKYNVIKNIDEISILNTSDGKEILKIDINKILTEIMLKKEFSVENSNEIEKIIPEKAMEYIGENENIKYKVAFKYIYTQKNDEGKYPVENYYMDFLFSEK
ncbi:MAG: DUF4153 domain-containing protein, partial [Leptotrichiaceae bacterium]|nr:DUF4153 domain-containing protein [Leptotrichiaceae bacterium]